MLSYRDDDGEIVRAGDRISFSFGIPPRRVECVVVERDHELWAIVETANVTPRECKLKLLRRYVGQFWRVTRPSE